MIEKPVQLDEQPVRPPRFAPRQLLPVAGIFLLALLFLSLAASLALKDAQARRPLRYALGHTNPEVLVSAIEKFHALHARYPASLEELAPSFLPTAPPRTRERPGLLYRAAAGECQLLIEINPIFDGYPCRYYDFRARVWLEDS
jgi:hypothetical protein